MAVSIEPLASFVEAVGEPYIQVVSLVPEGVEFHEYLLQAADIEQASRADLLVVTGHLAWEAQLITAVGRSVTVLDLLHDLKGKLLLRTLPSGGLNLHGWWLHPANAVVIVEALADILGRLDPARAELYALKAQGFRDRVAKLNASLAAAASWLASKEVVALSPAEQYLAEAMGLRVGVILIEGEGFEVLPSHVEAARRGLLEGQYGAIILSESGLRLPGAAWARQLAREVGVPLLLVRTLSVSSVRSYEALLAYNAGLVAGGGTTPKVREEVGGMDVAAPLLIALGLVAGVEGVILWRRSKQAAH